MSGRGPLTRESKGTITGFIPRKLWHDGNLPDLPSVFKTEFCSGASLCGHRSATVWCILSEVTDLPSVMVLNVRGLVHMWSIWAVLRLASTNGQTAKRPNGQTAKRPNGQGREAWPLRSGYSVWGGFAARRRRRGKRRSWRDGQGRSRLADGGLSEAG